jgi:hypothetical protein
MPINRFHLLTLPLAGASLALAACGEDGSGGSGGGSRAEIREAALDYAECMRRNGVDMPDPSPGQGGRITFRGPGPGGDTPAFERADEKCRKHLEDARPPELSEEEQREFRERALRHAQCMREHGIDMPDPTFGEGGAVRMRLGEGIDPNDPAFQEAQQACAKFGPQMEQGS